jgi:hypothetical protein
VEREEREVAVHRPYLPHLPPLRLRVPCPLGPALGHLLLGPDHLLVPPDCGVGPGVRLHAPPADVRAGQEEYVAARDDLNRVEAAAGVAGHGLGLHPSARALGRPVVGVAGGAGPGHEEQEGEVRRHGPPPTARPVRRQAFISGEVSVQQRCALTLKFEDAQCIVYHCHAMHIEVFCSVACSEF